MGSSEYVMKTSVKIKSRFKSEIKNFFAETENCPDREGRPTVFPLPDPTIT